MIRAEKSYPPDNELKEDFTTEPVFSMREGKEAEVIIPVVVLL